MSGELPDYAMRLDALHRALTDEFDDLVGQVGLRGSETVLDAGCGDGFFTELLARRLTAGRVIALDSSVNFLNAVRRRLGTLVDADRVQIVEGDVTRLPFENGSLDVVWSAHSMQSYDDVPAVLAEFRRVLRSGGTLAVLESDAMHSIMLPWPTRLELALRQAERRQLDDADDRRGAYFPRYASRLLREAGFAESQRLHTYIYRPGPLAEPSASYVRLFVEDLVGRTAQHLSDEMASAARSFAEWCAADGEGRADLYFGSLQVLMIAHAGGDG